MRYHIYMDISVFQVTGPIMTGPSSSHTAGAERIARVSRMLAGISDVSQIEKVTFALHGSFAQTYKGHGTDRALVAGVLGLLEDDEEIAISFDLAKKEGLNYEFTEIDLEGMHENSVKIIFNKKDSSTFSVIGSSIGGGRIVINNLNGFKTEFNAETNTLIVMQKDVPGVISEVSGILARNNINIAVMKVSRKERGGEACCIVETDSKLDDSIANQLCAHDNILSVINFSI